MRCWWFLKKCEKLSVVWYLLIKKWRSGLIMKVRFILKFWKSFLFLMIVFFFWVVIVWWCRLKWYWRVWVLYKLILFGLLMSLVGVGRCVLSWLKCFWCNLIICYWMSLLIILILSWLFGWSSFCRFILG